MLRAREWRLVGLLVMLAVIAAGCAPSKGTGTATGKGPPTLKIAGPENKEVRVDNKEVPIVEPPGKVAAPQFVGNFLRALGESKANDDLFTFAFKKKLARPRFGNDDDKKLGYNPLAVDAFIAKIGQGKYDDTLSFWKAASGPFFFGHVKTAAGEMENYFLGLVSSNAPAGWKIDWLHRTTAKGPPYTTEDPGPELIGANLAAHCFLENLLGGEIALAEATIAQAWKEDKCWGKTPSTAEIGYNPALLVQKFKEWKADAVEFAFVKREVAAGKPAVFEGLLLDASNKPLKDFTLKVSKNANSEWLVEEIEIK